MISDFRIVLKLVLAHLRQHPGRMILTLFSVVTAAAIVVWVVSGYDSLVSKFDGFSGSYLGRYQLLVVPDGVHGESGFGTNQAKPLDPQMFAELRKDEAIAALDPVFQTSATIRAANPRPVSDDAKAPSRRGFRSGPGSEASKSGDAKRETPRPPANVYHSTPIVGGGRGMFGGGPMLVGTDAAEAPNTLIEGRWFDPNKPDAYEAAISKNSAEQLGLKPGDKVLVGGTGEDPYSLTIVGIVEQTKSLPSVRYRTGLPASRAPALDRGPAQSALYVPTAIAADIVQRPLEYAFAGIVLKPDADSAAFRKRWESRLKAASVPAEFQDLADVDEELNSSSGSETMRMQAYSATGISLLAALFIIFTTLSMGVHERIRQFAVLRAVALTKGQIAGMILLESLFLGLIGWAGGLLAGWSLFQVIKQWQPEVITGDNPLGTWCLVLSGLCAVGGSLAASILPAWRATRVSPLEAMNPQTTTTVSRFSGPALILGLLLILINPLVVFFIPMADTARYGISAALGCTAMAVGFILLAPAAILFTERAFGGFIARVLGLSPKLLDSQLGINLWRSLGTTIALSLGLGLFVAMQTWGYSMLAPYTPGDWVPELLVGVSPAGIPLDHVDELGDIPGIDKHRFLPMAVEQTKLADDVLGAGERANAARQDNCVFLGVDPQRALSGDDPIFDFDFVEGNAEQAIAKLKSGRTCLVPDHFAREGNLHVGDKFSVRPPENPDQPLEYEIAGVVSMSGWHWLSKGGLRVRGGGRSAGLMVTDFDGAVRDFALKRVPFYWVDLDGEYDEKTLTKSIKTWADKYYDPALARGRGGRGGMAMGFPPRGGGDGEARATPGASVRLETSQSVRDRITERADSIIWGLSALPLITLGVTSLGIINTVLASIRARRWDLGILRALGITRFDLFRLIIAEAILVGIAACVLSFAFGTLAGYCGTGLTRYVNVRGGMVTPLVVPWLKLSIGFGITLSLCLVAALWPAFRTGRTEPLKLLQAGRSAM